MNFNSLYTIQKTNTAYIHRQGCTFWVVLGKHEEQHDINSCKLVHIIFPDNLMPLVPKSDLFLIMLDVVHNCNLLFCSMLACMHTYIQLIRTRRYVVQMFSGGIFLFLTYNTYYGDKYVVKCQSLHFLSWLFLSLVNLRGLLFVSVTLLWPLNKIFLLAIWSRFHECLLSGGPAEPCTNSSRGLPSSW